MHTLEWANTSTLTFSTTLVAIEKILKKERACFGNLKLLSRHCDQKFSLEVILGSSKSYFGIF